MSIPQSKQDLISVYAINYCLLSLWSHNSEYEAEKLRYVTIMNHRGNKLLGHYNDWFKMEKIIEEAAEKRQYDG